MAMVVLLLIAVLRWKHPEVLVAALALQLLAMTIPRAFAPLAVVWFGLSNVIGAVMSKVLLTAIFFLLVTPIGLVRRLFGKDPLQLRAFKSGTGSVMLRRSHTFSAGDLERPF